VTTDAEIDQKLARISERLQARRDELRRQLKAAPELESLLESWKATFGTVRVSHVQVGQYQHGDPAAIYEIDGQRGHVFSPAPYAGPLAAGRGKAAEMKRREGRA
jgi:hypothetical protein